MPNRTDEQLNAQFDAIKNETNEGGNTRTRVYNALKDFFDTSVARLSNKVDKETGSRLITAAEATKLDAIAPPAPSGVSWKTASAANVTITVDDPVYRFTETAGVITVNGVDVAIPAKELSFEKANGGTKRKDISVAKYTTDAATINGQSVTAVGYYIVYGTAVASTAPSVQGPAVPPGFLFVRDIDVTDGSSAPTTTTPTTVTLADTVTQNGETGVKGKGIYSFVTDRLNKYKQPYDFDSPTIEEATLFANDKTETITKILSLGGITAAEYQKNGGAWTAVAATGMVDIAKLPSDTVKVRPSAYAAGKNTGTIMIYLTEQP